MGLLDSLLASPGGGGLLDALAPALFADRFNAMPGANAPPNAPSALWSGMPTVQPAQPSPMDNAQWPAGPIGAPGAGRQFDPAMFDPASFAPNQASPLAVGNYMMPRIGAAPQFAPDQAAIPPAPQPAQGQMPPQAGPPVAQPQAPEQLPPALGGQSPGALNSLSTGLQSLAHGGSILGALTGNRTDPQSIQQQNLGAQYQAVKQTLLQSGMSPQEANSKAMLAVMNPEAGKTILTEALTNKEKYGVVSENPIEGKKMGFINERDQTINGKPIGSEGAGQTSAGLLAPGTTSYNPNLVGDEYLKQFSPEVQAATKAYIAGDVMPSGNPRQQGIASQAKTIAQKYGADMGIPVSDALYAEKRKYRTELGTNSPNAVGGQAKAFNQGIDHLTHLADNLEKLDNSNGLGIPILAQWTNSARQGFSTQQSAIADEARSLGQTVAGEVGKLFSGSAGGGVHERELTRDRFDSVKSKPQLAAALRATIETMDGGLRALEVNRDHVLGPNSGVEFVDQTTKANIAKIQGVIDRLDGRGGGPANSTTSGRPATVTQNGHTYNLQPDGGYK